MTVYSPRCLKVGIYEVGFAEVGLTEVHNTFIFYLEVIP